MIRLLSINSWFLQNSLSVAKQDFDLARGFEVKVWKTTLLLFLFLYIYSKCLIIYSTISIIFIVLSF